MNISKHTVLVTGATSGIGEALVRKFHARGCTVLATGRNTARLQELERQLGSIHTFTCDLTDKQQVQAMADDIGKAGFDVSVLVNNAAVQNTPFFGDHAFDFDAILPEVTTNFIAPAWLTALFLPSLKQHGEGGLIVNLSSALAIFPKRSSATYCATKAAIHNFSQSLRYQLEGKNVRVIEVLLPLVDTPMTHGRGEDKLSSEDVAKDIVAGLARGNQEIWLGKAKWLRLFNRLSPGLAQIIMKNY